MSENVRSAFLLQAAYARQGGSPLTATILETLSDVLDHDSQTGARVLDWPGDPVVDALALRLAGGLNALARSGQDDGLTALYAGVAGDWPTTLSRVLRQWDEWLNPWLDSAPQTNEVGRSGILYPGVMAVAAQFGPRVELIEIGASGGLNLNMDFYGYRFGAVTAGALDSPVQLAPDWIGPLPILAPVEVVERSGVDLNPLDLTDPATAHHMLAYIWPDQTDRVSRAEGAIAIACAYPPPVEQGDGADWIERKLAQPQEAGVTRIVYHSVALQYFPAQGRERVVHAIRAAGERATIERPLAWLSMEFRQEVVAAELTLQTWPGAGEPILLARTHPHGAHIDWLV